MRPQPDGIRERIGREARIVGLRQFHTPSLEAVEKRRLQLWVVTTIVLVAVSASMVLVSLWSELAERPWLTPGVMRVSILALAFGFSAYAIEKELHLRRLTRLLVDERVLTAALSNRLREIAALLEAGKVMNSVLELEEVLDIILGSALELLGGRDGSIMLLEGEDELRAVTVRGNDHAPDARVRLGEGIAGRVARAREPLLITGPLDPNELPGRIERAQRVDSAMCVPLVHRAELLGVLNLNAGPGRTFSEYDLRALGLFAEQAASAIANARLYEAERQHVAELLKLDRMKSEFIASVNHDLRTPLTSILAAAVTARRVEITAAQQDELLEVVERQTRRLNAMIEELLTAAELERGGPRRGLTPVDLAAQVRLAAVEFEVAGKPVEVEAPRSCQVNGDAESVRRILANLIDNAYKYGAPPVRVVVEPNGERVLLSVLDAGPGVPPEDRERVFDRFFRLDRNRTRPGLGLGLPIVRGLVAACGGTVWVDDVPGGGAAFRVALPLCPSEHSPSRWPASQQS